MVGALKHADFRIGQEFLLGSATWRVTDIGSRTVVAIQVDHVDKTVYDAGTGTIRIMLTREEAENEGWFNGPPYALVEHAFDEFDQKECKPA